MTQTSPAVPDTAVAETPVSENGQAPRRAYRAVPAQIDLVAMEHEIIRRWEAERTFERTLAGSAGRPEWTFYEGPPTANGMPGTHHIEARVFKDVFPRFRTMRGYHVDRKGGWDCHGLPVEIAVEKELGINGKTEIEAYGVAAFNARCRESVLRHVGAFTELTSRMGYWVDTEHPYVTMHTPYIESVWWALQQIFAAGLLVEDYRVTPYCPRCGTGLSDHELAQGYELITDPSVYVRFPVTGGPLTERYGDVALLVWTTTPWTLVSNTAAAVNPDLDYVLTRTADGEQLIVAAARREALLGEDSEVLAELSGAELVGTPYQRPFEWVEFPATDAPVHTVLAADFVTAEDGTGLVHEAPAFGAEDFALCRANGLPIVNPVLTNGTFSAEIPLVGGVFFKTADEALVADLAERGLLFQRLDYTHSYPHCWRCHTALIYYALPSWYIRTTKIKDALLRENDATAWHPDTIKHGRYGDWLNNNVDWALSRSRYWGTPLPIWRNDVDPSRLVCVASLAELSELTGTDLSELDPHRPFIDEVTFTVPGEEGTYRRVPEVIDAWFDSGSMPFAQWGFPHAAGSKEQFEKAFPADFICEAIDQTRGWFYSLMAVSTLVFDQNSYRNVVCLGHILAEDGRKMSKHLGNILEPIPLMDTHGADAVRWFMAAGGSPWASRRVGHQTISETVRKVLLTFWNAVSFQALYAGANDWTPAGEAPAVSERHVLDRWLSSQTQLLITEVTEALDDFDTLRAGAALTEFVDTLSNWYIRRSRRRFWAGEPGALWTLHETLSVVTRLMAPLAPFITERVWSDLFVASGNSEVDSVHMTSWPVPDQDLVDTELTAQMAITQRLVELGRAARSEAKMKVRQPLNRVLIPTALDGRLTDELRGEISAELNVLSVEPFAGAGELVDHSAKGNFRSLGKRFGKQTPVVAKAVAEADAAVLAEAVAAGGSFALVVPGFDEPVLVGAEDVLISERPREGWSVINQQGETVALDLTLTPELVRAGLAREVIRIVQESRKDSGFEVSDRITLSWSASSAELVEAIREHADTIAAEVLAVSITEASAGDEGGRRDDDLGLAFTLTRV
ncbi:isoleucyl-tRNA synthetase [Microlunatus phosphovorus NM-1]|uniref:Isoleucine--tRNA ligase n=1 Tax=Microlunatus phosphovorus (strain ATCC 700054 / DSM 10555 / JCM 9379 / NBRC 101784 / NCIMB 13414 / VKM Ac-1990 / NM-1) TaxID=1032480 RepID=F5XGF9_MICPN|nr:isoleucyl-tRNA synthetase [Microlunatus phosphovorus NM-1]